MRAGAGSPQREENTYTYTGSLCCTNIVKQLYSRKKGWSSLLTQTVKYLPAMQETGGLIPESGRSPGEGNGYPL